MSPRRFVLLDRDGTINVDCHYLSRPEQVELLPGAARGLYHLQKLGMGLAVITNQSAIGRGYFDQAQLHRIHQRLADLLGTEQVQLDGIYYCPHVPADECDCRKPRIGLVEQASRDLDFDPRQSFVIGDKTCDIELGKNLGVVTILVRTGYGLDTEKETTLKPDYVVNNLFDAAQLIQGLLEAMNYF